MALLKFCHIGEPLLIGLCGIKLPVQTIIGKILRVLRPLRATVAAVLDGGLNAFGTADTQNAFVIDIYIVVMAQVVIEPPVALIRTFRAVRRLSFPEAHLWYAERAAWSSLQANSMG